ncbi:glycosyltransferase family 61 protein [Nocardioides guangzhouensis]|uniref:Glycosyltransferase family 61 protein n=1 Tax=Nocardioides guangzhouensis TaxID=2497878 RepID=A0A4Q4ZKJ8_9ACTN|nr:glycosyltransferase family 61 protein [Nocardioides guangzhouensis]
MNSIDELVVRRRWVVAVMGVTTSAVVREEEMERYLELRGGPDRVLATIPGRPWTSRARLRASSKEVLDAFSTMHDPVDVSLRVHHDVVCGPEQTAVREDIVLPASYRHFRKPRLANRSLVGWTADFVRTPSLDAPRLRGRWFYLDNQHRGHFGHAMTEQISLLWAWREAKERHPDLRALVFLNRGRRLAEWEYELLAAGGVPREDIVMAEHPVRVESLFTATPMFSMSAQLHPEIAATWATIGETLAARASDRSYPDRVFCTRRVAKRACHNLDDVEEFFRARGFEVVVPEENPLADQVQLFRQASVIAGFAGSGMFQLALTGGPRHAILVSSESYTARNEYMISSVLGHRHDIAVCRADTPHPPGQWSAAAYTSDFTFDPEREGRFVDEVLAGPA